MLKIKNFMFGSNNEDRRTSHDNEKIEDKRKTEEIGKERVNKMTRVKWGRGKREANGK